MHIDPRTAFDIALFTVMTLFAFALLAGTLEDSQPKRLLMA
jgi:hypothetical protein